MVIECCKAMKERNKRESRHISIIKEKNKKKKEFIKYSSNSSATSIWVSHYVPGESEIVIHMFKRTKRQNKKQKWFVINKILSGNHMIDKNPNEKRKEEKKLKQEVQN